jgi:hypothetical protein
MDILSLESIPGNRHPYVLIIMDEFTRYVVAEPIRHQDADTVAKMFLDKFIVKFAVPEEIITDQGGCFMSRLFTVLCDELNIRKLNTCAYRPQGNGANERMHGTLYTFLRNLCHREPHRWRSMLPYAVYAYHTQFHRGIQMTPHEALFGYTPRHLQLAISADSKPFATLTERLENIKVCHEGIREASAQAAEKRCQDTADRRHPEFQPGDMVKVTQHVRNKLDPFWKGPYKIVRRNGPVTYELELKPGERMHSTVHQQYLRPWYDGEEPDEEPIEPPKVDNPRRSTPRGATAGPDTQEGEKRMTRSERKRLGLPLQDDGSKK